MARQKYNKREDVLELIEDYILENNLKAGDKLPSERQLSEMWDLNRMTVRNAIQKLANENILNIHPGSGTYVAHERLVRNLQDTFGFYESAVGDSRTIKTVVLELSRIEANKDLGQKMKLVLGSPIFKLVRLRFLGDIPTSYSMVYLDGKRFENFDQLDLNNKSFYREIKRIYGIVPNEGQHSISITYCSQDEAELLDLEENSPVLFQSGITRDKNGKIFEYFKELLRSDQVLLASELRRKENK